MATLDSEDHAWFAAALDTLKSQFVTYVNGKFSTLSDEIEALGLFKECTVCQGTGEVSSPVDGEPGPPYTCPRCAGSGQVKFGKFNEVE